MKLSELQKKTIKSIRIYDSLDQPDNHGFFQGFCEIGATKGIIGYHPALFEEQEKDWTQRFNKKLEELGIPLDNRTWDDTRASMMLHELIHSATAHLIEIGKNPKISRIEVSQELIDSVNYLTDIYNEILSQHPEYDIVYGMINEAELIAELSNSHFRGLLEGIKIGNSNALYESLKVLGVLLNTQNTADLVKEYQRWWRKGRSAIDIGNDVIYNELRASNIKVTRGGVSDNTEYSWVTHSTPPKSRLSYTVNASYDVPKTVRMMGESFAKRLRRLGIDAKVVDSERIESEVLNGTGVIASPTSIIVK